MNAPEIKEQVRRKYAQIALGQAGGCGCGDDECGDVNAVNESYEGLQGFAAEADLQLGCGIPSRFAGLAEGETVLDLGSGAGNDLFVARSQVGETGHLTGIDFVQEMTEKAERNRRKLGYDNMRFVTGDIDDMPLDSDSFDVVLSNCVLNLVPDKSTAFAEMYRVLRPGGRFCISDIVTEGELDPALKRSVEAYVGCVAGALKRDSYLELLGQTGFEPVTVEQARPIPMPRQILQLAGLEPEEAGQAGILSITVTGYKPGPAQ